MREYAGGDAGETLLFPLLLLGRSLRPPRPAGHTGKCSFCALLGRRPGPDWLLTADLDPQRGLRAAGSGVGPCNWILIKVLNLEFPVCKMRITN